MSLLDDVRERGYSTEPSFDDAFIGAWKIRLVQLLLTSPNRPAWPNAPHGIDEQEAATRLEVLQSTLGEVDQLLRERYGLSHLYNVKDPMAELLLIMLSRKTPEDAYLRAFERLLDGHDSWEGIHTMSDAKLISMVEDGGLAGKKAVAIKSMLSRVHQLSGDYSLDGLHDKTDREVFDFLTSLKEVGPKSTLCVMMYSLGRAAFPVDAHVGRIMMRLGTFKVVGLKLETLDHKQKQRYLADLVPPHLRYSLHVNALMLGREICPASTPQCNICPLASHCETGQERLRPSA